MSSLKFAASCQDTRYNGQSHSNSHARYVESNGVLRGSELWLVELEAGRCHENDINMLTLKASKDLSTLSYTRLGLAKDNPHYTR